MFLTVPVFAFSSETIPNLGMEDMLDDFLSFFIAGKHDTHYL